jgi:hypothetical protein
MTEPQIAKIADTFLGREDHGILTAYLTVDYGGAQQSVGGYFFDEPDPANKRRRRGLAQCADFIAAALACCDVDSWEKLKGRTVYVRFDDNRRPVGMAPLPTEHGRPFLFADVIPSLEEGAA